MKKKYSKAKLKTQELDLNVAVPFDMLIAALVDVKLLEGYGSKNKRAASVDEFMYMGTTSGRHNFKHYNTRNYVWVSLSDCRLRVGNWRDYNDWGRGYFGPCDYDQKHIDRERKIAKSGWIVGDKKVATLGKLYPWRFKGHWGM